MIIIDYRFMPLRLVLKKKEPVKLIIYVKDSENKEKTIFLRVSAETGLTFSRTGLKSVITRKVKIRPGKQEIIDFLVYPSRTTEKKYYGFNVTWKEYLDKEVINSGNKEAELKVE